jgi:hypothetical protein
MTMENHDQPPFTPSQFDDFPTTNPPLMPMIFPAGRLGHGSPGLLLADAEIQKNGLDLPGFDPLTYEDTIFRPHGTGVRRLEQEMEQETNDEAEAKAEKKWDPENHPSDLDDPGSFGFGFCFGTKDHPSYPNQSQSIPIIPVTVT